MQKQVYPNLDFEKKLPFYIVGIGVDCWQFPVERHNGYEYPQLFVSREGEGEIFFEGRQVKITPDSIFYIPPNCPHEYHALTRSWYVDWICFDGTQALNMLDKLSNHKECHIRSHHNDIPMCKVKHLCNTIYHCIS